MSTPLTTPLQHRHTPHALAFAWLKWIGICLRKHLLSVPWPKLRQPVPDHSAKSRRLILGQHGQNSARIAFSGPPGQRRQSQGCVWRWRQKGRRPTAAAAARGPAEWLPLPAASQEQISTEVLSSWKSNRLLDLSSATGRRYWPCATLKCRDQSTAMGITKSHHRARRLRQDDLSCRHRPRTRQKSRLLLATRLQNK